MCTWDTCNMILLFSHMSTSNDVTWNGYCHACAHQMHVTWYCYCHTCAHKMMWHDLVIAMHVHMICMWQDIIIAMHVTLHCYSNTCKTWHYLIWYCFCHTITHKIHVIWYCFHLHVHIKYKFYDIILVELQHMTWLLSHMYPWNVCEMILFFSFRCTYNYFQAFSCSR